MKKLVLLITLLGAISIKPAEAQKITGHIVDTDNQPVPSATVAIENTTQAVLCDDKGYFEISSAQKETPLLISCIGYENKKLVCPQGSKQTIQLTEKNNYLNTVVVTGTRTTRTLKDTPILTKVISSSDLHTIGAQTLLDALESLVPSVHFDPSTAMGDNIQVQGLDNNYILILIDGERVVPERRESVNFKRLNVTDIERIEIINGAASVLYGSNAIGSVINVITKKTKKPLEGYVQGRIAKNGTYSVDASVGGKINRLTTKTLFNYKTTDGYDLTPSSPTSFTVDPYDDMTVSQLLGYQFTDALKAEVKGSFYRVETKNPPLSTATTHNLDRNFTVSGKAGYTFSKKNSIDLSAYTDIFRSYKVYEKKDDIQRLDGDYYYTTVRLSDSWTPSEKLQLMGGWEYNKESSYSARLFQGGDQDHSSHNHNLFAQGTLAFIKNLDIVAGLRFTDHSGFGSHLSPAVSIMYKWNDFRFRTGVNNGFKAPTMKEMYYNFNMAGMFDIIGNPDLKSETSWYKFVSAEYINSDFNMSASLYHNKVKDKINTVEHIVIDEQGNQKQEMHYENVDDVRIVGVDVSLQWHFLRMFYLNGGYTYSDAVDEGSDTQIAGNSKHNATGALSFRYDKLKIAGKNYPFSASLSGRYTSPRMNYTTSQAEDEEGNSITVSANSKAFSIWRFTYTQQIPIYKRFNGEIQLSVDNLFDYVDDASFASINPGRIFSVMARINF